MEENKVDLQKWMYELKKKKTGRNNLFFHHRILNFEMR